LAGGSRPVERSQEAAEQPQATLLERGLKDGRVQGQVRGFALTRSSVPVSLKQLQDAWVCVNV